MPVLAVISCLVLLSQQDGDVWIRGMVILAVGGIIFSLSRLKARGRDETQEV
jgi:hypothetical protein